MDTLDIAKQRRNTLARELSKLDDFIRMGEELVKENDQKSSGSTAGPNTVRQFAAGNQAKSG